MRRCGYCFGGKVKCAICYGSGKISDGRTCTCRNGYITCSNCYGSGIIST